MPDFRLVADFKPGGDQPKAIVALSAGLAHGRRYQTLLGVTGSGKTFTMANVIANTNRLDLSAKLFDAAPHALPLTPEAKGDLLGRDELHRLVADYSSRMKQAAADLEFEAAAQFRDRLQLLREMELGLKLPSQALLDAAEAPKYWVLASRETLKPC